MKDYLLFIHGVSIREKREPSEYATELFNLVKKHLPTKNLVEIPLYWGDITEGDLKLLEQKWESSATWRKLWFQNFRKNQLLRFVGDAALYISRTVGAHAVQAMYIQAAKSLNGFNPHEDRLHIVAHSWGAVILFDILFASRWDEPNQPGIDAVKKIRRFVYGVPDEVGKKENIENGLKIASIHTMGSPLALYQLLADPGSSHGVGKGLNDMLACYGNKGLIWRNFLHPGDPITHPFETVLPTLLNDSRLVDIHDLVVPLRGLEYFLLPLAQFWFSLAYGGKAHGSYFDSNFIATEIAKSIDGGDYEHHH